jgi:hypothetical protein
MSPSSSGSRNKPSKKPKGKQVARLAFNGLQGLIFLKTELSVNTVVRTSKLISLKCLKIYPFSELPRLVNFPKM